MKRDWNLIRAILLAVERGENAFKAVTGHSADVLVYHANLLGPGNGQAWWITLPSPSRSGALTDNGRMIVGLIRDDAVWKFLRSQATKMPYATGHRSEDIDAGLSVIFRTYLANSGHSPLLARREALLFRIQDVVEAAGVSQRTIYRCEELNRLPRSANDRAAYLKALMWTEDAAKAAIDAANARASANFLSAKPLSQRHAPRGTKAGLA